MKYWTWLYPGESRAIIEAGADAVMKTAVSVMKSQETQRAPRRIAGDAKKGAVIDDEGGGQRKWRDSGAWELESCCCSIILFVISHQVIWGEVVVLDSQE
jgi:hypothetical protein